MLGQQTLQDNLRNLVAGLTAIAIIGNGKLPDVLMAMRRNANTLKV